MRNRLRMVAGDVLHNDPPHRHSVMMRRRERVGNGRCGVQPDLYQSANRVYDDDLGGLRSLSPAGSIPTSLPDLSKLDHVRRRGLSGSDLSQVIATERWHPGCTVPTFVPARTGLLFVICAIGAADLMTLTPCHSMIVSESGDQDTRTFGACSAVSNPDHRRRLMGMHLITSPE